MLPPPLLSSLFAATIVGATSVFARQNSISGINWFIYIYLIAYRTKIFLDDLVYYEEMKDRAVLRGDPAIAIISWVLWIVMAISIAEISRFFLLLGLNFSVAQLWIFIAKKNILKTESEQAEKAKKAHRRWSLFNFVPIIIGFIYAFLNPAWENLCWWVGPVLLSIFFVIDAITDYSYMLRLEIKA